MKLARFATAGAIMGALVLSHHAQADDLGTPSLRQPSSLQKTAFEYDNYLYAAADGDPSASPSDQPAAKPQAEAAAPESACPGDSCCCQSCCERPCRWCRQGTLADPWTLPQLRCLADRDIFIRGWMEGGTYGNAFGTPLTPALGFENINDGMMFNQLWLYAEKKANTDGAGLDWGFRADYLFGTDGPKTQCFGDHSWDFGSNPAGSRDYGSAMPQFFGEIALNNLTIKAGHFFTPMGNEVVPAPANFFYSHSYAFNFGEPFTHTGLIATYKLGEPVSVFGGWTDGWDEGFNNNNGASTLLTGMTVQLTTTAKLAWVICAGRFGDGRFPYVFNPAGIVAPGNDGEIFHNCLVLTVNLTDKWTYVLQNDIADNYARPGLPDAEWYGITQYLSYKFNDCWSGGGRLEWFRDDDGTRVIAGNAGNYYEATLGLNWKPHANFALRPEMRYDWYNGAIGPNGGPYHAGTAIDQFSGGCDLIFTY